MTMKILQFSRPPTPSYLSASEIPAISWPWTSNFKRTLPRLQLITNLLKEDIIQRLLLCYQVLPSGRLSFLFGWSLIIWFYVALYFCVCSCPKISRNVFYLFLVLILQSTCFICTTWKRKQTLEQQLHDACDRTKSKQQNQVTLHSNWPRVLLFDLVHKQCNDIIKGWVQCLPSESKGRFLVNYILMLDLAWCLKK